MKSATMRSATRNRPGRVQYCFFFLMPKWTNTAARHGLPFVAAFARVFQGEMDAAAAPDDHPVRRKE